MENQQSNPSTDPQAKQNKTLVQNKVIEDIMAADQSNRTCIDCNINDSAFISINQGVTVCSQCVQEHRKLGNGISFIVPLSGPWDSYLLEFILLGGNSKFMSFMTQHEIQFSAIEEKYNSKACDYYRRNLKTKVLHLGTIKEDFDKGNEVGKFPNVFPEFESYTIDLSDLETKDKFVGFFKNIGTRIKYQTHVGVEKISQSSLGMKIKEAGEKTGEQLKKAGSLVKETTGQIGGKVKGAVTGIASKIKKDTPATEAKKEEGQ
jgi:hypothetical protein